MSAKSNLSRSELVRQRRNSRQRSPAVPRRKPPTGRQSYQTASIYLPVEPRKSSKRGASRYVKSSRRKNYDVAFSLGRTGESEYRVHASAMRLPRPGMRWVSAGLSLLLGFLIYTMWTATTFQVSAAEVTGNQRLGAEDINAALGVNGQSIFKIMPNKLAENLRTAFPELSSVKAQAGLPNRIDIQVVERIPMLAWYQDGRVTWIDANGVAFTPRGSVPDLVQVSANGSPLQVAQDPAAALYEQRFISPAMVQAIIILNPVVPPGFVLIYDPKYGMGWQDPRGWSVFFGQNTQDIPMKLEVYQSIVDTLTSQGIQPTLISVEYLDAPFYK
jgi:cell division protein FtsQ